MIQNYDILERFNEWLWGYSPALVKPSLMMSTTDWRSEDLYGSATILKGVSPYRNSKCANLRIPRMVLK